MNDQTEAAQAITQDAFHPAVGYIVAGLATYGGIQLTTDAVRLGKKFVRHLKARKAAAETVATAPEA